MPGHFIELFPGGSGENEQRTVGYNHFCLLVDDLPATLQALEARDLSVPGEPVRGLGNNWQYWLTDPDGNHIELMQIVSPSPRAEADAIWSESQHKV